MYPNLHLLLAPLAVLALAGWSPAESMMRQRSSTADAVCLLRRLSVVSHS